MNTTLALHTCCAPCLIEPLRLLQEVFDDITALYFNPNISPEAEYDRRRDTFVTYARSQGLPFVELAYDPALWGEAIRDTPDRPQRCEHCYRTRFGRVIRWASEQGRTHFATTLTVSPYQDQLLIEQVARELCAQHGIAYAGGDYSDRYREATRRSRELGMYRQNYCGCAPSQLEAQRERARRATPRGARRGAIGGGRGPARIGSMGAPLR